MNLYILRHGRTNYNDLGFCNGDPSVDVYLTITGVAQAKKASETLKNAPLEIIFVSELPRTRQTADIINLYHNVPIETHAALNDILSGFEGQPVRDYQAAIAHDPLRAKVGAGESLLEYKQRVLPFVRWLCKQPYASVAVVAHEETLRIIYAYFNSLDDQQIPGLKFANCKILRFSTEQIKT